MARRKKETEGCAMDMTPMIDVVFQLIIFFIVTMNMVKKVNEDIYLADGKHGDAIKELPVSAYEIEVDRQGRISERGNFITPAMLQQRIRRRVKMFGSDIPMLIRADRVTPHADVKRVMDICTGEGVWKLSFVAVQKRAESNKKK